MPNKTKKILLYSYDRSFEFENVFDPKVRDNVRDPFIHLRSKLYSLGYELESKTKNLSEIDEYEWILFINSPFLTKGDEVQIKRHNESLKEMLIEGKDKIVLFLWEGKSVKPENYNKKLYDLFPIIFTWDDNQIDNQKFFKFYHPSPGSLPTVPNIPFNDKRLLVNISRNKKSNYKNELYSERIKTISYFDKHFSNEFDLYGIGWNKPISKIEKLFPFLIKKYPSYKGKIPNKSEAIPYYKYSICYENILGEKGMITEKIFDTLRLGSVPIYWGSSNITEYVDKDTFIDRRDFTSNKKLADYIVNMKKDEYNQYLKAIELYLKGEKMFLFLPENFANNIIKILKLK